MIETFFLFTILIHFTAAILGFWALKGDQDKIWYILAYLTMTASMTFGLLHLDMWFQSALPIPTFRESLVYLIHGLTAMAFHIVLIRKGSSLA